MLLYGIGAAAEAIAAAAGWSDPLYRAWYLAGAVLTPAWLGLGTAFLLGRTRFGYTYAVAAVLLGPHRADDPQLARTTRAPARCRCCT